MENIEFMLDIEAPKEKVWQALTEEQESAAKPGSICSLRLPFVERLRSHVDQLVHKWSWI